jgi:hypothetical protein
MRKRKNKAIIVKRLPLGVNFLKIGKIQSPYDIIEELSVEKITESSWRKLGLIFRDGFYRNIRGKLNENS